MIGPGNQFFENSGNQFLKTQVTKSSIAQQNKIIKIIKNPGKQKNFEKIYRITKIPGNQKNKLKIQGNQKIFGKIQKIAKEPQETKEKNLKNNSIFS